MEQNKSELRITEEEVRQCFRNMKNLRSLGPVNIAAEFFKYGSNMLVMRKTAIMGKC